MFENGTVNAKVLRTSKSVPYVRVISKKIFRPSKADFSESQGY